MIKKIKNNLYKEDTSTSLVGIIGVFIVLISFIGNNEGMKMDNLKANVTETAYASFEQKNINSLKLGEQIIKIDGKEYIVTLSPK